MPSYLCISIRFPDRAFHGRRDQGEPEWPPSPLRLFQALTAAAARRSPPTLSAQARGALQWLERQAAPTLVTPATVSTRGYVLSVPNNAMDIVASAWCRGNYSNSGDASRATHRTFKRVRPTNLLDGDTVNYLWPLTEPVVHEVSQQLDVLASVAKDVVALGWGVDLAVGRGAVLSQEEVEALPGEWWSPYAHTEDASSRVPRVGTLDALMERHSLFLQRIRPEGFVPPPPLTCFQEVAYRRATEPPPRPFVAFSLLKADASGFRPFDTARQALTVAGMVRHAVKRAALQSGWDQAKVDSFVLGHTPPLPSGKEMATDSPRFAYLPLPSLEARSGQVRTVGAVRRVMLTTFSEGCGSEFAWARRALSGQDLVDEDTGEITALTSLIPATDAVVRGYTQSGACWATVTPVVLPGYDDPNHCRRRLQRGVDAGDQNQLLNRLHDRIEGLLRKAIAQAGFSRALATHAGLEWRKSGFWAGTDLADRYGVPDHLKRYPRYHVKITWHDQVGNPLQVRGPICLGGGRFYGLGLLAAFAADPVA